MSMRASLICPRCGSENSEEISESACVVAYDCRTCGGTVLPAAGDGCVFCSYGDARCGDTCTNSVRCLPTRERRHQVVLGVSPFNSYYSERRLTNLFAWSTVHFEDAVAFVPDTPTIWTLEAGGYGPADAAHKTARQVRYLRNKITRAKASVGPRIGVLPWSIVSARPTYPMLRARCAAALAHDARFRAACLAATDEVLENRRRAGYTPTLADREQAVDYLLAELPLILFAPALFDVPTSTFVYHRPLSLFDDLFAGHFALTPGPGQHFVVAQELDRAA